ncbi:MAG: hypothetical protein GF353_29215 [Candidatus Lokiarchaeota archaeon]|nr:hypothetical protein [Candidatus Lokiarchaeota archaeon]
MSKLKCANCGNPIDTLPSHCGQDMIYNEKTNQMECYMGSECGYMELDKLLCESCKSKC